MWTFKIPNWVPPSLNKGRGRKFHAAEKCLNEVVEFLTAYNVNVCCPKVTEEYRPMRSVRLVVRTQNTAPDPDNLLKYLLDGMKRASLIVDDSAAWLKWETPDVARALNEKPRTEIHIADLTGAVQSEQKSNMVGGVEFTRAVVRSRPFYPPHDTSMGTEPLADFSIFAKSNGIENHFLGTVAQNEYQIKKLVAWAEVLGVPVEREDVAPEAKAKRPAVACDDEFKW